MARAVWSFCRWKSAVGVLPTYATVRESANRASFFCRKEFRFNRPGQRRGRAARISFVSLPTLKVSLCGITIDAVTMSQVVEHIGERLERGGIISISAVNVAKLVNMHRDPLLRESVESGDLVLADGMPLVWLSRLKGDPLPERVAGIDLMYELFKLADQRALRVFLLGAKSDTLERVVRIIREEYPNAMIVGYRDGYFREHEYEEVACSVRDARPDILLVAISSPKKELFMLRWSSLMNVPVCHGVGGSFDVMAGLTRRAPKWMQRSGLEWFYRFLQEPRRMWKRYLVTNLLFTGLAVYDLAHWYLGGRTCKTTIARKDNEHGPSR